MVLVTTGRGQGAEWREGSELDHLLPRHPSPPLNAGGRAYPTLPPALPSQSRMSLNHGAGSFLEGPEAALEGHRPSVYTVSPSCTHPDEHAVETRMERKARRKQRVMIWALVPGAGGCFPKSQADPGSS